MQKQNHIHTELLHVLGNLFSLSRHFVTFGFIIIYVLRHFRPSCQLPFSFNELLFLCGFAWNRIRARTKLYTAGLPFTTGCP